MLRGRALAGIASTLKRDVIVARERDPAARSIGFGTIALTYGGVQAVVAHRVAHALHSARVPFVPSALAYAARAITGVEIHPAARIGAGAFIDHGGGVVIGETAELGEDVTLYQGVTLGGTGSAAGKRHPTVAAEAVIGAGAKLLGPIVVGQRAKVGANAVVIADVPAGCTVVGNPAHLVRVNGRKPHETCVDWARLPDPLADALKLVNERVAALEAADAISSNGNGVLRLLPVARPQMSDPAAG